MKASIAAMIRLIAPHAARMPSMISMTALAAGTSSESSFSMASWIAMVGSAALSASHTISPI